MSALKILTGNPAKKKAASSTRFVFPFFYELQEYDGEVPPSSLEEKKEDKKKDFLFFKENEENKEDKGWEARRNYFTSEVEKVLFSSTKWLRIENWSESSWKEGILLYLNGKEVRIAMQPPQLVLFECPKHPKQKREEDQYDNVLQTGFLLLDLYFPEENSSVLLKDLLLFNDLFRYTQCPYPEHKKMFIQLLKDIPTTYYSDKKSDEEIITIGSEKDSLEERVYTYRWLNLLKIPIKNSDESYCQLSISAKDKGYKDERAYVWSTAVLEKGGQSLQEKFAEPGVTEKPKLEAQHYGHWIKFLNVDSPAQTENQTHQATEFEKEWAKERTYHRWEESGTWYGFSYHSGVMLTSPESALFTKHFSGMYFDMALLFFYTRVILFRYSRQIFEIQEEQEKAKKQNKDFLKKYSSLRKSFLKFSIRYQFPLLSNQQQGIELCEIVRKYFDIDELYMEIKTEIEAAYNFVEMQEAREISATANKIGENGLYFAIAAFLGILFSLDVDKYPIVDWINLFCQEQGKSLLSLGENHNFMSWWIIALIIASPLLIKALNKLIKYLLVSIKSLFQKK